MEQADITENQYLEDKTMVYADETKRYKAKQLRYKKPITKDLNLDAIEEALQCISEACYEVQYYIEDDEDTLINALDGDEDDAYEFKMMFSDLTAECEQMQGDLQEEYISEYFDLFFVAVGKGCEMLGYDVYEHDYYGLSSYESELANAEAVKKIKVLTKDKLIETMQICFRIYQSYIGLQYRYDCIKAAMDILRDENTGHLQMVKQIEELYKKADEETDGFKWIYGNCPALVKLERCLNYMPQEAWVQ